MVIPVEFKPDDSYSRQPEEKERIISIVQAEKAPQGATRVEVVNGWHSSSKDPKNHLTVDYFINSKRLARTHILEPKATAPAQPQPKSAPTSSSATSSSTDN